MSDFKNIEQVEKRLWPAADNLRANSGLTAQEYSRPVMWLIFLRYAEYRFTEAKKRLDAKASTGRRRSREWRYSHCHSGRRCNVCTGRSVVFPFT